MRAGAWYTLGAVAVALLLALVAGTMVGEAGRTGVVAGAAVGLVVQVAGFWLLSVWALPDRPVLAHGLGMLSRFLTVAIVALLWLPASGLPAAPTLLSLVGVFFLTMLLEPMALKAGDSRRAAAAGAGELMKTSTRR